MKRYKAVAVRDYFTIIAIFVSATAVLASLAQVILVKRFLNNQGQPFTGKWQEVMEYRDNNDKVTARDIFSIQLKQDGNIINGSYCFMINNNARVDCEEGVRIEGVLKQSTSAEVELKSNYSVEPVPAILSVENNKLYLKTEFPNATIPMEVFLEPVKE